MVVSSAIAPARVAGPAAEAPRATAPDEGGTFAAEARAAGGGGAGAARDQELSEEERAEVERMRARDQEVRAHEQAHRAAAAGLVRGGTALSYEVGPDGKRYAVAGEVSIDASAVAGDPAATIQKAQVVRRAALAPATPSARDRQVAGEATRMEQRARSELARQRSAELGAARAYGRGPARQEPPSAEEEARPSLDVTA